MHTLSIHTINPVGPQFPGEIIQLAAHVMGFQGHDERAIWRLDLPEGEPRENYMVHRGTISPETNMMLIPYTVKAGKNRLDIIVECDGQQHKAYWEFTA